MKGLTTRLACAMLGLAALTGSTSAVPVRITYTDGATEGFNESFWGPQRRTCFEAAVSNWASRMDGTVPVDINAAFDPMGGDAVSAVLGTAGPRAYQKDFANAPLPATWYCGALANQIAGVDLDPTKPDLSIRFNSDVDNATVLGSRRFYYGITGKPGTNVDFYTVALHEIGHGLGFLSMISPSGEHEMGDTPYVFDTLLSAGPAESAPLLTSLSATERAAALVGNGLYFTGPLTRLAGRGASARLYAPSTYQPGSSTSHLDEATYAGVNELMTPYASNGPHVSGPVADAIFRDMGWPYLPYTAGDVATVLRVAVGVEKATEPQFIRLNVVDIGYTWSRIDQADAARLLRMVTGLDPNP